MSYRIYISQPIIGLSKLKARQIRSRAENELAKYLTKSIKNVELLKSNIDMIRSCSPLKLLSENLKLMSEADAVYFVREHEISKMCKIEKRIAFESGIHILQKIRVGAGDIAICEINTNKDRRHWNDEAHT